MRTKSIVLIVVSLLTLIFAPSAAAATTAVLPSGEVVCFFESRNGILIRERCIAFRPIYPDCIKCDAIVVDFGIDNPYLHSRFVDGFVLLDRAAHTLDPVTAAAYRRAAQDRFTSVAVTARSPGVTRGTGFVDRRTGRFTAEPREHLVAACADIDTGLGLLRVAAPDPDGDPARERGMQYLNSAYERLA